MFGTTGWPKHFLYFSPEKVEALYAQITMRERRKLAGQLEVDLKLVKGSISFEAAPETFYSKLRLVLGHLDRENAVGSIQEPAQYVAGRLPMRWGTLGAVDGAVVFFAGESGDRVLGLGGSSGNVVGEPSGMESRRSGSNAPAMLDALRSADPASPSDALAIRLLRGSESAGSAWELDALETAVDVLPGVVQEVEFVARRLLEGVSRDGNRKVLLGTPLYVALAD
ncbi:DUF7019 family protein [Actinomadura bangladeshensis]|uniref:Uncharacterized protein n=1 Tax=Actinomadura bangladeshensis TaxID=453573 RepID=A0A4R4NQ93_9ACTN|nr:SAVMC3_10250 family protein [Actinomadura bangladeshensis]TDC11738.1 hypothetical protein E1284_27000 [Actinomadura bangladeshensis]